MLPDWLKAQVRARINENLTETCEIRRYTDAVDAYGNPEKTLVSSTEYSCFLIRANQASDGMVTGADVAEVQYEVQLPYDADIADGDEVVIGSEVYQTVQVYRNQSQSVMRQARLVKAGS